MGQILKIRKYLTVFFSGEILLFFASFISFPIFTRMLSKSDYGVTTVINLTISLCVVIGSAGIRDAVLRFYSSYREKGEENNFYTTSLIGILLTCSAVVTFLVLFVCFLLISKQIDSYKSYIFFFAVPTIYFRTFNFLQRSFLRIREEVKAAVSLDVILRYGAVVFSVICVVLWQNVYGFFAGMMFAEMAVCLYFFLKPLYRFKEGQFKRDILKISLLFGLPLMAEHLVSYFLGAGDRYIITYFLGAAEVANYSVAYNYCEYPLTIIRNALLYSFMPIVFNEWNAGKVNAVRKELTRYFRIYVWLSVPVILGLSAVSENGITLVAGERYKGLTNLVPLIGAGVVLNGMNFVTSAGLILAKKTIMMLKITVAATMLNLALNAGVVPFFGLYGAAGTTLISYLFYFIASMLYSRKEFKFPIPYIDIFQSIFCGLAMYFVVMHVPIKMLPVLVGQILLGMVTYILFAAFFWRKYWIAYLKKTILA